MLPFSALDSAAITTETDAVSKCHEFGSSVPFGLRQSNNVTLCSTESQQDVDVTDTVNAVGCCCYANVECAKREFVQLRPRSGGLVFHADDLPLHSTAPSLFVSKCPPPFSQFQVFSIRFFPSFFRRAECSTPNTPILLHHQNFFLLACALRASLLSSLGVPHFPRRRCTNVAVAGTVAAGNDFALLDCITTS